MYTTLLLLHSAIRWLVLASLAYSLYRSGKRLHLNKPYTRTDNFIRHLTATVAHIQLIAGILLYIKSPWIKSFIITPSPGTPEAFFFSVPHISIMVAAIVSITIGSALAKRRETETTKYKTQLWWFGAGLLLIFVAIPWPFSPFAQRPYIRIF